VQKLLELRKRMRVVDNIRTVTRTLATVSAAKLSRTRTQAAGIREYAATMRRVLECQQAYLSALQAGEATELSPFFAVREPCSAVTLLHITGDRGMCGNYNQVANRLGGSFVAERIAAGQSVTVITKGTKGEQYLRRRTDAVIEQASGWSRAGVTPEETEALYQALAGRFLGGDADEVWCVYTQYYSPLKRVPRLARLLPVAPERLVDDGPDAGPSSAPDRGTAEKWSYEPSFGALLEELISILVRLQVEDALLESYASEQGARMVTMEEATERADKALHEMRMRYNRMRREAITTDLVGVLFASQLEAMIASSAGEGDGDGKP
jgi:F-type H+-transporting ATPase subunit gamma